MTENKFIRKLLNIKELLCIVPLSMGQAMLEKPSLQVIINGAFDPVTGFIRKRGGRFCIDFRGQMEPDELSQKK